MMRDVLVVMNGRNCEPALQSIRELSMFVPIIYMKGFTEREIQEEAFPIVLDYDYDWFWLASDDIIIRQHALRAVRKLASKHAVVTGYSQRSHSEWTVNLTSQPIRGTFDSSPQPDDYTFREYKDVVSWPSEEIPTWFTGMSLTGMSKVMWQQFPFECIGDPGWCSDFSISHRLQTAQVPIVGARDAFCYHWRNDWVRIGDNDDQLELGAKEVVLA
jgi:hypothetical protein